MFKISTINKVSIIITLILLTISYVRSEPINKASINVDEFKSENKDKFILLNYWASWCPVCASEGEIFNEYNSRPSWAVLGINAEWGGGSKERILSFNKMLEVSRRFRYNFPVTVGVKDDKAIFPIPTTIIVDTNGKIAGAITGKLSEELLRIEVKKYLKDKRAQK